MVMVTHDVALKRFAHRVIHTLDGKIAREEHNSTSCRVTQYERLRECLYGSSELPEWLLVELGDLIRGGGGSDMSDSQGDHYQSDVGDIDKRRHSVSAPALEANTMAQTHTHTGRIRYSIRIDKSILPHTHTHTGVGATTHEVRDINHYGRLGNCMLETTYNNEDNNDNV
eukprot:GHVR01007520.1.p1 GENE.GHVR01007520.1~~GHVR01007520.1.p1  ORF type:complete len:189 (-),score=77.26 GHVR01007520.1:121-630(-)